MPSLEELISTAQNVVTDLNKKLLQIEEIHQDIKDLRDSSTSFPTELNNKYKEIVDLTINYTNTLSGVTKTYIDGNNNLFTANIKELQTKIHELKNQVDRLEGIDLLAHFDKLQKTLTDIFGAINTINLTVSGIIQTLTGIVQSIGTIQTSLDTNNKESKRLLNSLSEATEKHLTEQDNQAKKNLKVLESNLKSLSEQNELLINKVKTNRRLLIIGFILVIIILILQ